VDVDRDLVLALRRKEQGALDEVYQLYRERLWRFLSRLAWSQAEAEDLFQETWLAVARHAHRLREDTNLAVWLFTIARNKHKNSLRSRAFAARRRIGLQRLPTAVAGALDDAAGARIQVSRVAAAFSRLADAHREVLLLCLSERLEPAEAARVLGIREDALRKRLSRARAALTALLDSGRGDTP
jgi:RNA polymerase sigma-70 factor (ECF subfamily)